MDAGPRSVSPGNQHTRYLCRWRREARLREACGVWSWGRIRSGAVHSSVPEQGLGLMSEASELRKFPVFEGLPEDQMEWFLSQANELRLKAGEVYARQGDVADGMYVLLEGEFQWRGECGGQTLVRDLSVGD